MYDETLTHFAGLAGKRALAARSPLGFLAAAALAGAYIGIAMILALTVGAGLPPGVRPLAMGGVFGIGLILVVFAGAELFTGYALYLTIGLARRTVSPAQAIGLLLLVWFGNLIGSVVLAYLFAQAGGSTVYATPNFLSGYLAHKVDVAPMAILARAVLCNWLVCLAIWTAARIKSESAKVIVMAWCLLAFVAPGFEHSVADMTALSLGFFAPGSTLGFAPAAKDLLLATLGNLVGGGVFVAGAYLLGAPAFAERPLGAPATATLPQARAGE